MTCNWSFSSRVMLCTVRRRRYFLVKILASVRDVIIVLFVNRSVKSVITKALNYSVDSEHSPKESMLSELLLQRDCLLVGRRPIPIACLLSAALCIVTKRCNMGL